VNLFGKNISTTLLAFILVCSFCPFQSVADGKELWGKFCMPCHGKDGKAQTPIARKLGVKDLTQTKLTGAEIEKQINEGKRDDHGKELMPSFKSRLSADEIKSLVTVVKDLRKPVGQ
jgi:cytochrome c6